MAEGSREKIALPEHKTRRGSLFEVGFPIQLDRGSSSVSMPKSLPNHENLVPQKTRYENTYRMEPTKSFNHSEVKGIVEETLESSLKDETYEVTRCRNYCKSLSHTICERVKLLGFYRYKIICVVYIGEKKDQAVRVASRFVWDEKHDNWVDAVYEGPDMYAVAVVYGVYHE